MPIQTLLFLAALLLAAVPRSVHAQDPQTRAEALQRQREEKAAQLSPPEPRGLERFLLTLENRRTFERLLNPAEGFYPKIGNITAGSGFAGGPAYRNSGLFGGHADVSAFGMVSTMKYWKIEGRLAMPRLADGRMLVDVHAQLFDYPDEDFFGLGADSRREDFVTYGLRSSVFGGTVGYRLRPWLSFTGSAERLTPDISASDEPESIGSLFTDATAPGLATQPAFARYEAAADLNYREPRGNPRRGGRYALTYQRFDDLDGGRYSFDRVEVDLQQYIPIIRDRRTLALHAVASMSDAAAGSQVPFYYQRTLGGPDDLRGFRRFRFRDENMILLQAEYRWEIFTAVDGAIFYDAGKVASRAEDLDLRHLESNYGIGFRFGTVNGVFLRVEGAFGSSGGKHFILRFGHVF